MSVRRWLLACILVFVYGFYGESVAGVIDVPGPSNYFCPGGPVASNTPCVVFNECLDNVAADPNDWTIWQAVWCEAGAAVWQVTSGVTGSGSGAPIDAPYLTRTPSSGLSAEQALSLLGSGLMFNTTGTGVVSIYAGALCTTQFVRSLTAAGVATCASVDVADLAFDPATQIELDAHVDDSSAAHAAAAISFTPADTIEATDVQAAIVEAVTEAKAYADAVAQGLDPKASVGVCTTANLTLSGEQTIDGVLTSTSRILVKDQTLGEQNGIYVTAAGAWARSGDADISAEVTTGLFTFCEQGTAHGSQGWVLVTPAVITLDTTPLTFTQFSGAGTITAGAGLQKIGSEISVAPSGITTGLVADGTLTTADLSAAAGITKAQNSNTGAWEVSEIPDLPASKITSGTFDPARLPTPTASTLGGVMSGQCGPSEVADGYTTAGALICVAVATGTNTITSTAAPVDGVDACEVSDRWLMTTAPETWYVPIDCTVGSERWIQQGSVSPLGEAVDESEQIVGVDTETIAHTFTIPADTLATGTGLQFEAVWTVATQGNVLPSTYRVRFGTTGTTADTELIALTRLDATTLRIRGMIIRTGSSAQVSTVSVQAGTGIAVESADAVSTAHDLAAATYLTLTVDPGEVTDDMTLRLVGLFQFGTGVGLSSGSGVQLSEVALGGGDTATLGTISGSGPTTGQQAGWLQLPHPVTGLPIWIPYWE